MVGTRALVNPSVRRVIAAVDAGQPGIRLGGTLRARWLAGAAGLVGRHWPRQGISLTGPADPCQARRPGGRATVRARPAWHTGPAAGPGGRKRPCGWK